MCSPVNNKRHILTYLKFTFGQLENAKISHVKDKKDNKKHFDVLVLSSSSSSSLSSFSALAVSSRIPCKE
jgi:hypothetical protein